MRELLRWTLGLLGVVVMFGGAAAGRPLLSAMGAWHVVVAVLPREG